MIEVPSLMESLIEQFGEQMREAIAIGEKAEISKSDREISNIVVTGLGGSGIGGNLVSDLIADQLCVPFFVNKGYSLPSWASPSTLVIACSYSGNTEETIKVLNEAHIAGCLVKCITSGGKMLEFAQANQLEYIKIPGGNPPRASLGYSFVQQLYLLAKMEMISFHLIEDLKKVPAHLESEQGEIKLQTEELANAIKDLIPIIYCADHIESVAVRWRQQINENAKMLCWHHVIPEMNHNELVGWKKTTDQHVVIFLRDAAEDRRNSTRIAIMGDIISKKVDNDPIEIHAKGESAIERALYLIHYGDWLSLYLAYAREVDAVEVDVIDFLKSELAKS